MSRPATIVWFRLDLRLGDHPALRAAIKRGGPVIPVFIWAPEDEQPWSPGAASNWWLHQSLTRLQERLEKVGSSLVLCHGDVLETLRDLIRKSGADAVYWNRRYEPAVIQRDARVKSALREEGCEVQSFNAALLHEPWTIETGQGTPYKVFTPYYRNCLRGAPPAEPQAAPRRIPAPARWPRSVKLEKLGLEPSIDWAAGLRETWTPGELGAHREFRRLQKSALADYATGRDRPDVTGTSRLSPHLHFGEISPRKIWYELDHDAPGAEPFLRQLVWRDFAHHLLFHFPHTTDRPLRPVEGFPWRGSVEALRAWQKGKTGYPIVDAGMRELWHTGWMHNRVRMIAASFLIKDLLIPWQEGAKWFWDTLVDADLANNTMGWQWVAGSGADASPYFRIFNPVTQGERYDPQGTYVQKYIPELTEVVKRYRHQPWKGGGKVPGYPEPIVDHATARQDALDAYDLVKRG